MRQISLLGLVFVLSVGLAAQGPAPARVAEASPAPVAEAAERGDKATVQRLLKDGADVNAAQGDGMSALHWAAERGDADLADILLYAGANVSATTRIGQYTPLHIAGRSGAAAVAKSLLKAGADVNAKTTTSGVTALHMAASSGNPDTINVLLDAKADVNAKENEAGQTPLIFASGLNRVEAIKTLLARGADPGVTTKVIDVAKFSALDRAAADLQRKVLEGFVGKESEAKASPSQIQAAIQAGREIVRTGKIPPPDPNAPPNPRGNFNPEEINPPVQTK
ncbi:MAG TPA: ankyrin repeat domain-containing protein, partial [Vicinamibacterales bacterium]